MREERRRLRYARRAWTERGSFVYRRERCQPVNNCFRCAGSKRRQRVAQGSGFGTVLVRMAAVEMDELAELVDVLDGVLQRRLPAGKQRDGEEDPC